MTSNNKYTQMQQEHYDTEASKWSPDNRDPVVGSFDKHNAWADYNDYLFKNINTQDKIALDFGCGPGRGIVQFAKRFKQIDGIDISKNNLDNAKIWSSKNKLDFTPNFYKSNGTDIKVVENNSYDVIYSTICMQHICVYEIRLGLLKEFYRVLKPGGSICIQMGFGDGKSRAVDYYEDNYDSSSTNGWQDVRIDDPCVIRKDLENIGFKEFDHDIRPIGPGDGAHAEWIFFRAIK